MTPGRDFSPYRVDQGIAFPLNLELFEHELLVGVLLLGRRNGNEELTLSTSLHLLCRNPTLAKGEVPFRLAIGGVDDRVRD